MTTQVADKLKAHVVSALWTWGKIGVGILIGVWGVAWRMSAQAADQKAFNLSSQADRAAIHLEVARAVTTSEDLRNIIQGKGGLNEVLARLDERTQVIQRQLQLIESQTRR